MLLSKNPEMQSKCLLIESSIKSKEIKFQFFTINSLHNSLRWLSKLSDLLSGDYRRLSLCGEDWSSFSGRPCHFWAGFDAWAGDLPTLGAFNSPLPFTAESCTIILLSFSLILALTPAAPSSPSSSLHSSTNEEGYFPTEITWLDDPISGEKTCLDARMAAANYLATL